MERVRADVQRAKVEPKNYVALNRKKITSKKSHSSDSTAPILNPVHPYKISSSSGAVGRRSRPEVTPRSDIKRSIEQLASIISRGDLDKILQLAKEVKTLRTDQQPNQLLHSVAEQPHFQPTQSREVKVVQPNRVPGLDGESNTATLTSALKPDIPIFTTDIQPLPPTLPQPTPSSTRVEPHYGRGQGLRQLLELDSTNPIPIPDTGTNGTSSIRERHRREKIEEKECYYPWGKPGAGAPLRSCIEGQTMQGRDGMAASQLTNLTESSTIRHHQSEHAGFGRQNTHNLEPPNPMDEKKRRAFQYMLELQAQVKEKERMKREQQEKQSHLDRLENARIEKERKKFLFEAEKEKEKKNQEKRDAHQRFQFLQAKVEEQHQLALKNKKKRFNRHITSPPSHTNSPLSTRSIITDARSNNTTTTIQSPQPPLKSSVEQTPVGECKGSKVSLRAAEKMKSEQQGRIRNPPPSQMNVIKPSNRTHLLVRDKKSSSMPIIVQAETERGKEGTGANRHAQDDCYSDVSKSSTVTSLDRTTSLLNMHTESQNTLTKTRADKEEARLREKNQELILQLQKLKQGLYVKQQELHSEFF